MPQIVTGHAAVFYRAGDAGTVYQLPTGELERVGATAFTRTTSDGHDITANLAHMDRFPLGGTAAGTLALAVDARGLAFRLALPDTAVGEHLADLVRAGRVRHCSIRFEARESRRFREGGRSCVELIDVDLVHISLTHRPAYHATAAVMDGTPLPAPALVLAQPLTCGVLLG